MAVERLSMKFSDHIYHVENNPDNSGVRIIRENKNGVVLWLGTIIGSENGGLWYSNINNGKIFMRTIPIKKKLVTCSGNTPPLKIRNQVEVNMGNNKQIVARYVDPDDEKEGIIVGYSDGNYLWGVAFCSIEDELLLMKFID